MGENRGALNRLRLVALGALPVICAGGALWWVMGHFDARTFRAQVTHLDPRWILAAVFFDALSYIGQGYRWRRLLEPVANVSGWSTTRAIYAALFVNEIVPMRPGEVLRGLIVARESGLGVASILPSMVAERLMDGLWLVLAICGSSLFVPFPPLVQRFSQMSGVAAGVLLVGLFLARKRIPPLWLVSLRNRSAFAASLGMLCSQGLAVWSVLRGCHLSLPLFAGVVVMLVLRIGTSLPGAPANVGTHQLSTMLALSLFGVPQAAASPIAFVAFAVLTIPLWLGGIFAFASLGLPLDAVWRVTKAGEAAIARGKAGSPSRRDPRWSPNDRPITSPAE